MKNMKYIATIIFSLMLQSYAHASPAWILWAEVYSAWDGDEKTGNWGKHDIRWNLINAHERKNDCEKALNETILKLAASKESEKIEVMYKVTDNIVSLAYVPKNSKNTGGTQRIQTYRYLCIPDTIDPRKND